MDAVGEVNNYAMPRQAARQYINLNHLPDALRHFGLFFMLVATTLIIQNLGQSSVVSTGDAFTIFSIFILGLWMFMLSLVLQMFPLAAERVVPLVMEAIYLLVFGLRVHLLFKF